VTLDLIAGRGCWAAGRDRNGGYRREEGHRAKEEIQHATDRVPAAHKCAFRFGLWGGRAKAFIFSASINWRNEGQYLLLRS